MLLLRLNECGQVPVSRNRTAHMGLHGRGSARTALVDMRDAARHDAQVAVQPDRWLALAAPAAVALAQALAVLLKCIDAMLLCTTDAAATTQQA